MLNLAKGSNDKTEDAICGAILSLVVNSLVYAKIIPESYMYIFELFGFLGLILLIKKIPGWDMGYMFGWMTASLFLTYYGFIGNWDLIIVSIFFVYWLYTNNHDI